ncbi:MAG: HAD-IB family hydrolase [Actinomycetota bacterium]|nr:HAD-IB family hydrolase [Actinomycetota bacterium]
MSEIVAFFDLDHTLLDGSNGNILALSMVKNGQMKARGILWVIWYSVLYRLNKLPRKEVYRKVLEVMGSYPVLEMIEMMDNGFEERILPRLFDGGARLIRWHRSMGHRTVIATAAGEYIAERVRAQIGADDTIATPIPIRGQRISSEHEGPTAFMEGKLEMALDYCGKSGVDISRCYFYSDSASDLPLLEAVGNPVLVNPQVSLRIAVRGRGWSRLKFRKHARFDSIRRPEKFLTPEMEKFSRIYEENRAQYK